MGPFTSFFPHCHYEIMMIVTLLLCMELHILFNLYERFPSIHLRGQLLYDKVLFWQGTIVKLYFGEVH